MEDTITISKHEYEELLIYKQRFMEEASINKKQGRCYQQYLKDKGFLEYIKEHDELIYKEMLKEYNKKCELQHSLWQ